MQITRQQCQQIANGWRGQLAIAVDNIVRPERTRQMIVDFYRHFDDVELLVFQEVFNGVWDALSDGRVELAIGATQAIPVGGRYAFRDMGTLASMPGPLSDDILRNWPSLVREDTSRTLPKRITWLLDNQKRVVVPDWESSATCLSAGLCVGMVPLGMVNLQATRDGAGRVVQLFNCCPDRVTRFFSDKTRFVDYV